MREEDKYIYRRIVLFTFTCTYLLVFYYYILPDTPQTSAPAAPVPTTDAPTPQNTTTTTTAAAVTPAPEQPDVYKAAHVTIVALAAAGCFLLVWGFRYAIEQATLAFANFVELVLSTIFKGLNLVADIIREIAKRARRLALGPMNRAWRFLATSVTHLHSVYDYAREMGLGSEAAAVRRNLRDAGLALARQVFQRTSSAAAAIGDAGGPGVTSGRAFWRLLPAAPSPVTALLLITQSHRSFADPAAPREIAWASRELDEAAPTANEETQSQSVSDPPGAQSRVMGPLYAAGTSILAQVNQSVRQMLSFRLPLQRARERAAGGALTRYIAPLPAETLSPRDMEQARLREYMKQRRMRDIAAAAHTAAARENAEHLAHLAQEQQGRGTQEKEYEPAREQAYAELLEDEKEYEPAREQAYAELLEDEKARQRAAQNERSWDLYREKYVAAAAAATPVQPNLAAAARPNIRGTLPTQDPSHPWYYRHLKPVTGTSSLHNERAPVATPARPVGHTNKISTVVQAEIDTLGQQYHAVKTEHLTPDQEFDVRRRRRQIQERIRDLQRNGKSNIHISEEPTFATHSAQDFVAPRPLPIPSVQGFVAPGSLHTRKKRPHEGEPEEGAARARTASEKSPMRARAATKDLNKADPKKSKTRPQGISKTRHYDAHEEHIKEGHKRDPASNVDIGKTRARKKDRNYGEKARGKRARFAKEDTDPSEQDPIV